jgi:hypothetical protein
MHERATMSGTTSKKFKIQVELIVEFANSEIERGAPDYVAEHYADIARTDPRIGALSSYILMVETVYEVNK